jgi:hypothetical protein
LSESEAHAEEFQDQEDQDAGTALRALGHANEAELERLRKASLFQNAIRREF